MAVIVFDGPGLGATFHRMSMVAEPRPVGTAILDRIAAHPDLDPDKVAMFGMSIGGYLAIRMASHDPRIRAVAAVSPPYSADIYWNVTLASLRRELAALYQIDEQEMGNAVPRITLSGTLPRMRCPLLVVGGGRDFITPGSEAWRIFEDACCERELVYYPRAAHECFNVLGDLRPRVIAWIGRALGVRLAHTNGTPSEGDGWMAGEAVDPDFADALAGEASPRQWRPAAALSRAAHWGWAPGESGIPEVVIRRAPAVDPPDRGGVVPLAPDAPDILPV
jgi:dienelactone hydrolase